jgi:DNA-binding LacI/PurR family transcriptional regulator
MPPVLPPRPTTTIADVARRAQVSPATVSRVLNASAPVSASAAQAVRTAAAQLGFRVNMLGRSLRANRSGNIGVVLPTLAHPVFAECLQGVEQAAHAFDLGLMVATTGYDPAQENAAIERLLRHRVDGLVLTVANSARSRVLDKLDAEQMPYVLVYNQPAAENPRARRAIGVDNRLAAQQIVAHLLALGHRRIAMVAGSFRQSDRTRLRHRGYRDALSASGRLPMAPIELPFMADDARPALHDLLCRRDPPTALFCSSDQLALRVMRDLALLGKSVPEQVSVAGFDGVRLGTLTTPTLTTVVQPSMQIGACALELLRGLLDGSAAMPPQLLSHRLRLGESTAPPRSIALRGPRRLPRVRVS